MPNNSFSKFESIAQRLVEGSLGRLFGGRLDPVMISAEIAHTIELESAGGYAPNQFEIVLHPTDYSYMRLKWPEVSEILVHYVIQIANQLDLELATDPMVSIKPSPDVGRQFVRVEATHIKEEADGTTQVFVPVSEYDPLIALKETSAYLIVDGYKHVALEKPIMTLGRHSECDIVLDDRTISRRHSQIRWRFGRFILYDLGSRGGTRVNGVAIDEFVLRVGDVIEIADEQIIYGESESGKAKGSGEGSTTQLFSKPKED